MAETTPGGAGWPSSSSPAECTRPATSAVRSLRVSSASAITDRHRLAVHSTSTTGAALTVNPHESALVRLTTA